MTTTGSVARVITLAASLAVCCVTIFGADQQCAVRSRKEGEPVQKGKIDTGTRRSVIQLSAQLGDHTFQLRETATRELITIGKVNIAARNGVRTAMTNRRLDEDPEVTERARRVLSAIMPPRPIPRGIHAVTGAS